MLDYLSYYSGDIYWLSFVSLYNMHDKNDNILTIKFLRSAGRWKSSEPPSLYIFINSSTRELGYIEKYVVWCLWLEGFAEFLFVYFESLM